MNTLKNLPYEMLFEIASFLQREDAIPFLGINTQTDRVILDKGLPFFEELKSFMSIRKLKLELEEYKKLGKGQEDPVFEQLFTDVCYYSSEHDFIYGY